jgi:hypothetical protein
MSETKKNRSIEDILEVTCGPPDACYILLSDSKLSKVLALLVPLVLSSCFSHPSFSAGVSGNMIDDATAQSERHGTSY